jgi:hypothetical protein
MELVGWAGAFFLSICAIPLAVEAALTKRANYLWTFLSLWLIGEVLCGAYAYMKSAQVSLWPLLVNYGINIVCILIVMVYNDNKEIRL